MHRFKYIHMEEMLGNVPGARQIFERWMAFEPDHHGWMAYIKVGAATPPLCYRCMEMGQIKSGCMPIRVIFIPLSAACKGITHGERLKGLHAERGQQACMQMLMWWCSRACVSAQFSGA